MPDKYVPNFQQALDEFEGNLLFKGVKDVSGMPSEKIYTIDTNDGVYYFLEIDYISDFMYVIDSFKEYVKIDPVFIKVKKPKNTFEEYSQIRHALKYKIPQDFDVFRNYLGYVGASFPYYFLFLAKSKT